MRLVGASNRFIQTPFILEGVLAALIGSVLAGAATVGIVQFFVQGFLAQAQKDIAFVTVPDALVVVPILIGVGVRARRGLGEHRDQPLPPRLTSSTQVPGRDRLAA